MKLAVAKASPFPYRYPNGLLLRILLLNPTGSEQIIQAAVTAVPWSAVSGPAGNKKRPVSRPRSFFIGSRMQRFS